MRIIDGELDDARVADLLLHHLRRAREVTPVGSAHALDLSGLRDPAISLWSIWEGEALLGVGALKRLSAEAGEVKSMHTAEQARRRGAGAAMLRHIMATARARGMTRLYLETGSFAYFAPARALYAAHGFVECEPFGDYRPDPNSTFMTRDLSAA